MSFTNGRRVLLQLFVLSLFPLTGFAQITRTELAGNPLPQYPFFEYVRAFNVNAPLHVSIDPTRFPAIVGKTCDVYVVNPKTDWPSNPGLTDVTPGGHLTRTFVAGSIQANTFEVAPASSLSANAGAGLGVGYDVVLDCDQNGSLSPGDYIDGMTGDAGLYMVHDITQPGPHAVTDEPAYNLDSTFASGFGIPGNKLGQKLYFPANAASMGKLPLVIISRGNGHDFRWYGHLGNHLASYGYVVLSHDNNTEPSDGTGTAMLTTIGHTDAFIALAEGGTIAGSALVGHLDARRIVWIGHSRGAEGVARAYHRLFAGTSTPANYSRTDIKLVSSMLPTDFGGTATTNPHDAPYHLWTASGDRDVDGSAVCWGGQQCQTFHLHDRATAFRQSTVVQGTGHAWFHAGGGDPWFTGPCAIGEANTHLILKAHMLALIKHYVQGNVPALDFLTRPYESFHPIGVDTSNACIKVSHEHRNASPVGNFVIDDYQTNSAENVSSSGGSVTFDVEHLAEGRLDDNNTNFAWTTTDPFNGATQGGPGDDTRGVVFDWTDQDRFYEWEVPSGKRNLSNFLYLSFRAAQGTQHPNTVGNLDFTVTLRDGGSPARTSSIRIGASGGALGLPYARSGGWHNEMRTVRMRITDFLNNGSGLDLSNVVAVKLSFGPSFGSSKGRMVLDELMLTNDVAPLGLQIIEPTTARPSFAGTSVAGNRVLVRVVAGGGLDVSPANLSIAVAGTPLTPVQIPTSAAQVSGETWMVIAPGPKPDGCYDLAVTLTTPAGVSAAQPQSLCYRDDEARAFDRVLAIDQTNSMNWDGVSGVASTAKMDAARAAAKFFVDLSNPSDQIGVISFQRRDQDRNGTIVEPDELAEVRFPLTTAGEGPTDQRPAARTAMTLTAPDTTPGFTGPETSIGAGLVRARTMLNAGGIAGRERNIVLLTDGLENYPPYWSRSGPGGSPLRPQFEADNIRVDTVGVGADADDALLGDIAALTNGEFRNLNEGSGSYFLLSRLANWYKAIDEDVRGEQRFFYREGFPKETSVGGGPAGVAALRKIRIEHFVVEPGLDWITLAFHANTDHAATVELFEPGSATPIVVAQPGITYRSDPKHGVYRIRSPKPGLWSYVVQAHDLTAEFFAIASGPTLLAARLGPNQLERTAGGFAIPLRVWVADRKAVQNALVDGHVRQPNGVKVPVALLDDGAHDDGASGDAIYGLRYLASLPGAYSVELRVTGTSNAGEPFERHLATTFVVPGQQKRPVQYGEGLPGRPGSKLCHCASDARYSVALFGGRTFPTGAFNMIADSSYSLGAKAAIHFAGPGGRWSTGLYLGRDNFKSATGAADYRLTHLSPELEFTPALQTCPIPSFHAGVGAYRNESGDVKAGYNLGASLSICLADRTNLLLRYDFRSVHAFSRDYSTLQLGMRFRF